MGSFYKGVNFRKCLSQKTTLFHHQRKVFVGQENSENFWKEINNYARNGGVLRV